MLQKDGAGRVLPSSKQRISRTLLLTLLPPLVPARTLSSLFRTATAGASVHRANMVPPSATASTSASRGSYSFFGDGYGAFTMFVSALPIRFREVSNFPSN
ncbi:hypothetical protein B0H16DRAFT_1722877 [Mycena metata]|uniref:Uncharacterized protein n=1 Tax=Mycena metata TaxID=1033252 RepID=A0AAD7NC53_9AGAR|nr:hypothetical protein B0H16DRAFT_1722877 [Mycena metata]